jgi:hypothetical protein
MVEPDIAGTLANLLDNPACVEQSRAFAARHAGGVGTMMVQRAVSRMENLAAQAAVLQT